MISVSSLPHLNATLNAASGILLILGYVFIRQKRIGFHRVSMLGACITSSLFLISYLIYHYNVGSKPFLGEGWIRPIYFTILISHTVLAVVLVPLVVVTLVRAGKEQFERHRLIARWTLPLWCYVSVTGVVVYLFLYRLYI